MKVSIKKIGMLDEAEFEVGDLTLICGENNTGKTYATYSLYGYLDFMRTIRRNVLLKMKGSVFDSMEQVKNETKLSYEEIKKRLEGYVQEKTKIYSNRILFQTMAGKREDFLDAEFNVKFEISLENIKYAVQRYLEDDNLNRRYKRTIQHTIYDDGLSFSSLNKENFDEYLDYFFDAILKIIFMRNFILSVERTGASIFQEELDFYKIAKLETMQKMLKEENIGFFEIEKTLDRKNNFTLNP